jgi:hypothetical protein
MVGQLLFFRVHRAASSPRQQLVFDNPEHNPLGKKLIARRALFPRKTMPRKALAEPVPYSISADCEGAP